MIFLEQVRRANDEDLPVIYCDMDQVLCNFMKGAEKSTGEPFATAEKERRWEAIRNTKDFWANLEWMPEAKRLYRFIDKYEPHILSAYSTNDPNSQLGKRKWLKKNTNITTGKTHLVLRAQKRNFATTNGKPNLLIDDYIKNIQEWERAGGIGVHHTSVTNTITQLKRLGFK